MKTCEAAVQVLRETNNPAVMWGDEILCHAIAERAKLPCRGNAWRTTEAVLRNLSRNPGELVQGYSTVGGKGCARVRIFYLPEHSPWRMP